MASWVDQLSPDLLWDVRVSSVDPREHLRWILERVLERGRWEDWLVVKRELGNGTLRELLPTLRVDAKSRNFLETVVNGDQPS